MVYRIPNPRIEYTEIDEPRPDYGAEVIVICCDPERWFGAKTDVPGAECDVYIVAKLKSGLLHFVYVFLSVNLFIYED